MGVCAAALVLIGVSVVWVSVGFTLAGPQRGPAELVGWLLLPAGMLIMYAGAAVFAVFQRRILRQYGIKRNELPRLKLADLNSLERFDAWLKAHGRLPENQ